MNSHRNSCSSSAPKALRNLSAPWRWGLQVACLVLALVVYVVLEKVIYPFRRGFFCDDQSIRYPAKDNAINFAACLGIGLAITLPTIVVVRIAGNVARYGSYRSSLLPLLQDVVVMVFGAFACQATLDAAKLVVGRLRPSFVAVCFGRNLTAFNALCATAGSAYVTDFDCVCTDKEEREARLSFPSGHTSFMLFTAVFTICYLQKKNSERWVKLLLAVVQVLYLNVALAVSMSRISNYKHHWSDVLGGVVYGTVGGYLTAHYLLDDDPTDVASIPLRKNGRKDVEATYTDEHETRPIERP